MKRVVMVLTVGLIAGVLAGHQKAFAQGGQVEISSAGAPTSDLPMADLQAFDQFRAAHPEIVQALSRNPKLRIRGRFRGEPRELYSPKPRNGRWASSPSQGGKGVGSESRR